MARFIKASDTEPLLKLERPTPACSQSAVHIINAAFSDVLSAKPHDPQAVSNMAVSKRGESVYHDNFVDQLTRVSEIYNERLVLLTQLERHLVQARAKALADDEKALTAMTEQYPVYSDLNLPRGPSQLRKYLDEKLLSHHHLLVPSQFLPAEPKLHSSPKEMQPSYFNPTITATMHAHPKGKTDSMKTIKQSVEPSWHYTLPPEERELEKIGLSNFNRKSNYLRNSRYSKTVWSNTASSGPVKMKQGIQPEENVAFAAEPKEVQFTDYSIGETYKATLELKNISSVSRQLRLVPLSSSLFKVSPSHCPTNDGLVAPGLAASYTVTFTPHSLSNCQEELKFTTGNDEEIVIKLVGFRPPPILNIPDVLEVGYCLAGGKKTCVVECINTGGEGTFTLMKPNTRVSHSETPSPELVLGPFTISPTQFHLPANEGVIPITLSFAPNNGVGDYSEDFSMACDNGQIMNFTIQGVAQKVCLGCVSVSKSLQADLGPDLNHKTLPKPVIHFSTINPHSQSTGSIFVKNHCNVELSYHWLFYRPITEPPQQKAPEPLINQLVPSENTPFSVDSLSGSLVAEEVKKFTFTFSPCNVGSFIDMSYLVITGMESNDPLDGSREDFDWLRLSSTEVAMLYVQLYGEAKDFSLNLHPPALLLPYKLSMATDSKKEIKLTNNSLSAVCYQWLDYECESVTITVEPPHGRIDVGEHIDLDVCIHAKSEGPFSCNLLCELENCDKTLSLPISGKVDGPIVGVSVPYLNFGLVAVGRSHSLMFKVTSHTNCTLDYTLRQVVEGEEKNFIDIPCLSFSSCAGELPPNGGVVVTVECTSPGTIGKLKTIVQLLINGKPSQHFWAFANLQRPQVSIEPTFVNMGVCYIGIEFSEQVVLTNNSPVPAQFTWSSQVGGDGVRVCVTPMTGRVDPHKTARVTIAATWTQLNPQAEAILCCEVLNMESPLFIQLSAQVKGLSVSYSQPLRLTFGPSNKLGVPVSRTLTVTNTSGIPASLEATVIRFPPACTPTPPLHPKPEESCRKANRDRGLLGRTMDKSTKQATSDYSSLLLRGGKGCCFVVEPSSTFLPPFTPVTLTLTAHSDMWGEYTDQLVCKVHGVEDTVVPVNYGAVGCPIVFHTTATVGYTLARLGAHAPGAKPIKRVIRLKNTSPVDIRVDWEMFNIVQNDDKIVDFHMAIGDPLPLLPSDSLAPPVASTDALTYFSRPLSRAHDQGLVSRSESCLLSEKSVVLEEPVSSSECKLDNALVQNEKESVLEKIITAFIQPHKGVRSSHPFDIHPKQIVLPANDVSSVEVTFHPNIEAMNQMGPSLASYALGYLSLDTECLPNVNRKSGYEVEPLRIDIMADIEHARLSLQYDEDNGLEFSYPASILLQDSSPVNETNVTHSFTLLNTTPAVVEFKLVTTSPNFIVSNISRKDILYDTSQFVTLKPQRSLSVDVSYTISLEDVRHASSKDGHTCTSNETLQVLYCTSALQEFPLTSNISLPHLTLSTDQLEFGTVLIDCRPAVATVVLSNTSLCDAVWSLELSTDLQKVISVCPSTGLLPRHLSGGAISTMLVEVKFSPRRECGYNGVLRFTEVLTGREQVITVTGKGSADEKYIPTH